MVKHIYINPRCPSEFSQISNVYTDQSIFDPNVLFEQSIGENKITAIGVIIMLESATSCYTLFMFSYFQIKCSIHPPCYNKTIYV